jgi:hypothetical protein
VFGPLTEGPPGQKFGSDDIKAAVKQWFQQQTSELFAEGIHCLVHQWYTCLNTHWNYF